MSFRQVEERRRWRLVGDHRCRRLCCRKARRETCRLCSSPVPSVQYLCLEPSAVYAYVSVSVSATLCGKLRSVAVSAVWSLCVWTVSFPGAFASPVSVGMCMARFRGHLHRPFPWAIASPVSVGQQRPFPWAFAAPFQTGFRKSPFDTLYVHVRSTCSDTL